MNAKKPKNEEDLDVQVYDVEQCFRISWLREFIFCYAEYHSYQVDDI